MGTRPGRNGGTLNAPAKGDPSPNPAGKPKGTLSIKTIIRRWLEAEANEENPVTGEIEKLSQMDLVTLAQLSKAKKGDTQAFSALMDRLEGKPKQSIEAAEGTKIKLEIIRGRKPDDR